MADINGNNKANTLRGTDRDDDIEGRGGNDRMYGLGGNDELEGGRGNDILDGGAGRNDLEGGLGDDIFIFKKGKTEIDDFGLGTIPSRSAGIWGSRISTTLWNLHARWTGMKTC